MGKKTVRETIAQYGTDAERAALALSRRGKASTLKPLARREKTIDEIVASGADPLRELARIMLSASDPKLRAECAKALAPYLYAQQRAVAVSGPDGEALTIEVRKV